MTNQTNKKPVHRIRLGRITATIWENPGEQVTHYNTTVTRSYRLPEEERDGSTDSGWRETNSFGREDLLLVCKASDLAHTWIYEQNAEATS